MLCQIKGSLTLYKFYEKKKRSLTVRKKKKASATHYTMYACIFIKKECSVRHQTYFMLDIKNTSTEVFCV